MHLSELRKQIDKIDEALVALLNKRGAGSHQNQQAEKRKQDVGLFGGAGKPYFKSFKKDEPRPYGYR